MAKLKTAASVPKRNITFAENGPEIIGYRDPSDDEDEEDNQFDTISLEEKTSSSSDSSPDYDENDPERVKLRQLTESNTLFNSNYQNFKLNDAGTGLGRTKSSDSGPIKFVIQDGYQQPLPPTKYKSNANANLKKLFENGTTNTISCDKPKPVASKPVVNAKPVEKQPEKPAVVAAVKSQTVEKPKPTQKATVSDIPTIKIPRVSIQADKINRSPPPVSSAVNPLADKSKVKPEIVPKPTKPDKPLKLIKPEVKPPEPEKKPEKPVSNQTHRNSVILLDANSEGAILPLDSQKLPAELKHEDVVDNERLYMVTKSESHDKDNLDSMSDSGSDSGASGCTPLGELNSPPSSSPTAQLSDATPSTSPSPDSLDSSPDSYDLMKSDESDMSNRPSPVPPPSHPPPPPPPKETQPMVEPKEEKSEVIKENLISNPIPPQITLSSSNLLSEPTPDVVSVIAPKSDLDSTESSVQFKSIKFNNLEEPSSTVKPSAPPAQPPAHPNLVKSNSIQSTNSVTSPNPNNKTMISISYRRSSSQQSSDSNESKRNVMLAKLAMDLEQHRSDSSSNLSNSGSIRSSSTSLTSNTVVAQEAIQAPKPEPVIAKPEIPKPQTQYDQFIEDCYDDEDDDEITNSKSKKLFNGGGDSTNSDDSDSECDPLPDMIKSDVDSNASLDSDLSDDENSKGRRRSSKESESKSSTSSLGSKSKDKSVSGMFKSALNNSNTKKYTKMMKKNLSKTSKFIVNTTKQIGNETQDMVKKLKDKGDKSKADFYYPDEYSEPKSKSKWTFSPNQQESDESEGVKKPKKKFEVYSMARNAFKNIEGKIKTSGGSKSGLAQAEFAADPFGGSGQPAELEGPALLKIKRLDSIQHEPNYSEPNLLLKSSMPSHVTQSDSNLQKPPLPPRNYRAAPPVPEQQSKSEPPPLPENPPQAPIRRKKLAKKRDQLTSPDVSQTITQIQDVELTIVPPQQEVQVSQAQPVSKPIRTEFTLAGLKQNYEHYFNVLETTSGSLTESISVLEVINDDSKLFRLLRCQSKISPEKKDFYLLSSKITYTTCFDADIPTSQFQSDPCRVLAPRFSRFMDASAFAQKVLHSSDSSIQPEIRSALVDSLVHQLYTILARFEQRSKLGSKPRTIGDVNEVLIGTTGDISDVLLLIPTKDLDTGDEEDGDSLSMMQSFCLQVFLIRLTSMITNEDQDSTGLRRLNSTQKSPPHYRNLVRRNQNGFSSLRDLYLLASLDIFRILPASRRHLTADQVEPLVSKWFQESSQNLNYDNQSQFKPISVLDYARVSFTLEPNHQPIAIALAQKELTERT